MHLLGNAFIAQHIQREPTIHCVLFFGHSVKHRLTPIFGDRLKILLFAYKIQTDIILETRMSQVINSQ
jgi:hypothetical protein